MSLPDDGCQWNVGTVMIDASKSVDSAMWYEREGGNLRQRHRPCEYRYLSEYLGQGKPKIPPADRIPMDPSHKARNDPSDNADLDFQAVGPALRIMQLNVEGCQQQNVHTRRRSSESDAYRRNLPDLLKVADDGLI